MASTEAVTNPSEHTEAHSSHTNENEHILPADPVQNANAVDEEKAVKITTEDQNPGKTVLLLSLKGPSTCRHLINDICSLLPENTVRDSKLKERFSVYEIADIAELRDADNALVIETRKRSPAPIFWAVARNSAGYGKESFDVMKFILTGVYTMTELKYVGNPLANTQMTTLFTPEFSNSRGLRKAQAILTRIFNTTREVPESPEATKDYVDKIASFFILDEQIHVRFYHIQKKTKEAVKIAAERARQEKKMNEEQKEEEKLDEIEKNHKPDEELETDPNIAEVLASDQEAWYEIHEIGPRFTLHPRESDLDDKNVTDEEE
ncbi:ribosome biogenesis protein BRX1 [Nematocida major]|uniref:ribosome biogenesis protein BRX1 n=1 Tax=Nematocida major TaxID=1912982 RepID=UPI0020087650|nr:ribosome biogenesis protein BRX1 [Nematocida major]KAH9386083.1 ribosome biogenesis protein BRX1 [Nematocida major]